VTGGQKPNLLDPLVKLVSHLDGKNIKMPGVKPVDSDSHLQEITQFFILAQYQSLFPTQTWGQYKKIMRYLPQMIVAVNRFYNWHFNVVALKVEHLI
jgi:hypothetical protein